MNLPNKLTFLRIILVPVFVLFMYLEIEYSRFIATIVFMFASFTDFLDGYLARRDNLVTNFGKFADPLADKILVCAALACLVGTLEIPAWTFIVVIAREFAISGFRIIAASENITIAASNLGKIKTFSTLIAIILLLFRVELGIYIYYFAIFFTILSGIDYIVKNIKVLDLKNI